MLTPSKPMWHSPCMPRPSRLGGLHISCSHQASPCGTRHGCQGQAMMHRDLSPWRLQGCRHYGIGGGQHRIGTSYALMPYMLRSGKLCRLRAGRRTSEAHVDHLVEDDPPKRLLIQHQVQGEQQHEEAVADVPKHHRKEEGEGHDSEDLQPAQTVSAVRRSNKDLRAAQTVSASCSGTVCAHAQATPEGCQRIAASCACAFSRHQRLGQTCPQACPST